MGRPEHQTLLGAAVAALGGAERPGQRTMVDAVAAAMRERHHLLVQAGTGTGKSLGYLVPAVLHARAEGRPVVVATATLALQAQLVDRELPLLDSVAGDETPLRWVTLKGRANYACLYRVRSGVPDDDGALVAIDQVASGPLGREVLRARDWAEEQASTGASGDRDHLEPGVGDRAWAQVSVSARECLGATACPFGSECFTERARAAAEHADVVVTNHAMLAFHWIEGVPLLPGHDTVVVDEGHELAARITGVATAELSAAMVSRAVRRSRRLVDEDDAELLDEAGSALEETLGGCALGRMDVVPSSLASALGAVRDAARRVLSALTGSGDDRDPDAEAVRRTARAAVEEVYVVAGRMAEAGDEDVLWLDDAERFGRVLRVAPLSVAALVRGRLLREATVVVTSATLQVGGSFEPLAGAMGLVQGEEPAWEGLDVGSPFDYQRQGILYVAAHLPTPGRDGPVAPMLDELAALVAAAGGHTLGLFSSRRAAEQAAEAVRDRLPEHHILCQGDDVLATLVRRFRAEPATSLFGTLSLWQGVDIPGDACRLVVIDRIPFPRPDDPLMSARARAADKAGSNGFMAVSATHAALLLAQGAGRLVRTASDRGVVAVLDPRLVRARYGSFLLASLPPMWRTRDRATVVAALERLRDEHRDGPGDTGAG
jgi:ATP-dependent DNA helicase DinG